MGIIFDIKRYAIHDGPGIRVTVFFKGCPLRCAWCHNPESIERNREIMYTAAKCIGCGECARACPVDACRIDRKQGGIVDPAAFTLCGACVNACPARALEMVGEEMSVIDILNIVEKQRTIIDQSDGGITISGGEPLMQPKFLIELLDACGRHGLHRAIDTAGLAPTETLLRVAKRTDYFLFDLKMVDPEKHKYWTGVNNALILKNLTALAETGAEIEIRMPLIKGVNCEPEEINAVAAFIAALPGGPKPVAMLPFHDLATAKRAKLGKPAEERTLEEPGDDDIQRVAAQFTKHKVAVTVGG